MGDAPLSLTYHSRVLYPRVTGIRGMLKAQGFPNTDAMPVECSEDLLKFTQSDGDDDLLVSAQAWQNMLTAWQIHVPDEKLKVRRRRLLTRTHALVEQSAR